MAKEVTKIERNILIDILKGLAIFLVVFGHFIQYYDVTHNIAFFSDTIFKFIYSFHMPLFIFLSGFLFYDTIKKYSAKEIIFKKFKRILIPLFIVSIVGLLLMILKNNFASFNLLIKDYLHLLFTGYWFVWALLMCFSTITIVSKLFKDKIYIYLIIFLLIFLLPDGSLTLYYKYMLPFFLVGYYINKIKIDITKTNIFIKIIIPILFFVMLFFFKDNYYIYTFGMELNLTNFSNQIYIILYRYIIGFLGIFSLYILTNNLVVSNNSIIKNILKPICYLSKYTYEIYLISSLIFIFFYQYLKFLTIPSILVYFSLLLISMILILFCLFIIKIIKKERLSWE